MLYDLMVSMENATSVGAIVGKELAESFVRDIFENGLELLDTSYAEAFQMIEDEEFLYVSVLNLPTGRVEYTIQELIYDNGVQALIEDDIIFIEDNLMDVYDESLTYGQIVVLEDNKEIEEEMIEDIPEKALTFYEVVDKMVDYLMDVISKEKCPRCLRAEIEEVLIDAYEYGME